MRFQGPITTTHTCTSYSCRWVLLIQSKNVRKSVWSSWYCFVTCKPRGPGFDRKNKKKKESESFGIYDHLVSPNLGALKFEQLGTRFLSDDVARSRPLTSCGIIMRGRSYQQQYSTKHPWESSKKKKKNSYPLTVKPLLHLPFTPKDQMIQIRSEKLHQLNLSQTLENCSIVQSTKGDEGIYQELSICISLLLFELLEALFFWGCAAPKVNSWGGTSKFGREKMEVAAMLLKAGTEAWLLSVFGRPKLKGCTSSEGKTGMEGLGPSIDPNSFFSYSCSCWCTAEIHSNNVRKVLDEVLLVCKRDYTSRGK